MRWLLVIFFEESSGTLKSTYRERRRCVLVRAIDLNILDRIEYNKNWYKVFCSPK